MPLRPRRLLLAALACAATIGVATAAPSIAAPAALPVLPALSEADAAGLVPAVTEAAGASLAGMWFEDGKLIF